MAKLLPATGLRWVLTLLVVLFVAVDLSAADRFSRKFTIHAGKHGNTLAPIVLQLAVPKEHADAKYAILTTDAPVIEIGQLTAPSLLATPAKTGENVTVSRFARFKLGEAAAE